MPIPSVKTDDEPRVEKSCENAENSGGIFLGKKITV